MYQLHHIYFTALLCIFVSVSFCFIIFYIATKKREKDRVDITISVMGGLIQHADIPKHLGNVVIVVKNYDVEDLDDIENEIQKDADGEYTVSEL